MRCVKHTVELWWLELVGTVGASSTHWWVQVIPGLTIFKGIHIYFMFTMDTTFLSIKAAKYTGIRWDWRMSSSDPWCSRQASLSDQSSTVVIEWQIKPQSDWKPPHKWIVAFYLYIIIWNLQPMIPWNMLWTDSLYHLYTKKYLSEQTGLKNAWTKHKSTWLK